MSTIFRRKRSGHAWETSVDEGEPGSGDVLPAASDGYTVDDTTYQSPIGDPDDLTTLVIPVDSRIVFALAKEGDAFPCLYFGIEVGGGGWFALSSGGEDPYLKGGYLAQTFSDANGTNAYLLGPAGVEIDKGAGNFKVAGGLPAVDPGIPGTLYHTAGVVKISL